jgi:hypothetical protein
MIKMTHKITYDDREYVIIAVSSDENCIQDLAYFLDKRLLSTSSPDDAILSCSGHTSQLLILESIWETLSDDDKLYYQAFCDGWTSKTND